MQPFEFAFGNLPRRRGRGSSEGRRTSAQGTHLFKGTKHFSSPPENVRRTATTGLLGR